MVRLAGLTADSAFMHYLYPVDEDTGKRARRVDLDADNIDAYLLRIMGGAS